MNNEPRSTSDPTSVAMPAPTVAPLVLALGIALAAIGVATSIAFVFVGGLLFVIALGMWIGRLLPGRGHCEEPLVEPALRPRPVIVAAGRVERMRRGMPGYRLRLPERVHPISAGIKGGLVGGLVMPLPAMSYGVLSGHGIWMPINLLAGMALPGVGDLSVSELEQFRPTLFALGAGIHVTVSLILGLLYGVLMPSLPKIPKPLAWGALLMPLLWTAVSFVALGVFNPTLRAGVDWPWFVVSQFIFGVAAALVFMRSGQRNRIAAGLQGGIAGGLLMPLPALLWGWLTNHGIWYPINLLAAMAMPHAAEPSLAELEQFHANWLIAAIVAHAILSISFGLAYGLVLPRMPEIPAPMAWGGLVMPMLWTASSFGLMGVLNPALQEYVDWPWFVVSQFVFGVVAATVVVRSEEIGIPPAGRGPDRSADYLTR
jgi:hypothetical protein